MRTRVFSACKKVCNSEFSSLSLLLLCERAHEIIGLVLCVSFSHIFPGVDDFDLGDALGRKTGKFELQTKRGRERES